LGVKFVLKYIKKYTLYRKYILIPLFPSYNKSMNKKNKTLLLGTMCLAILGSLSFWYTSSHTASLKSQALKEPAEAVFQMLHETCLNEIVNL
jgi:hypothetical protein